jgi:ACS family glucarate transporter-like MFS transporter
LDAPGGKLHAQLRKPQQAGETQAQTLSPLRWWVLALLTAAMLACYAQRAALSVAAPFLQQQLHLSQAQMGIVLSSFFWTYAFMQVPSGWLVDHWGVRRAYAAGFGIWSVASAAMAAATGFASLVAVRLPAGIAQAVAFPASAATTARWFADHERGFVTAVYLSGARLGQVAATALGGVMIARIGYPAFFVLMGLAPLVWILPWVRLPDRELASSGRSRGALSVSSALGLLRQRTALGIFLGFFAYDYTWFLFTAWLPSYLVMERHFTPGEMALYASTPFLANVVVTLVAGAVADRFVAHGFVEKRVRKVLIVCGLLSACLIAPAGLVDDKMTAVWLLTAALGGMGLAAPNTWTLTQAVCARSIVGTMSGLQNFGGNLAGIASPAVTGMVAQATGSFAAALVLAGLVLAGGIASYAWLIDDPVVVAEA